MVQAERVGQEPAPDRVVFDADLAVAGLGPVTMGS
jgi:hypothetical protein